MDIQTIGRRMACDSEFLQPLADLFMGILFRRRIQDKLRAGMIQEMNGIADEIPLVTRIQPFAFQNSLQFGKNRILDWLIRTLKQHSKKRT